MQRPFQLSDEMKLELQEMTDALDEPIRQSTRDSDVLRRPVPGTDRTGTASRQRYDSAPAVEVSEQEVDLVNHPPHYTGHPSGVECIQIVEWMNFCLGNAVKYIWRADLKHDAIEDLEKARWYLEREITRRRAMQ